VRSGGNGIEDVDADPSNSVSSGEQVRTLSYLRCRHRRCGVCSSVHVLSCGLRWIRGL
jgi:hypothetical protein